jgi:ACS family sodium-dependent inorganic phosphate cotransporter|tara:strand:- start:1444 stop:2670 length:1227 start_codon:yes stop_codon:yes gene_type:complete
MMSWLLAALLLCYIDRILISLAAIEMQREFAWSDSDKGLVLSSFFMGYLVMQMLGGLLSNRFGGRNVFLAAVLLWSLFTILTPLAAYVSFTALVVVRLLLGVGEGAAYPSAYNLIHSWMPLKERSLSIGLISAAASVGTVAALLTTGKLIEWFGWQFVFYLFGSLGFVWALFWVMRVPSVPITPNSQQPQELTSSVAEERGPIPWRVLSSHPAVLTIYLVGASAASISFTMASWMPSYFVDTFALSISEAGFYSMVPWALATVATLVAGRYADQMINSGMPPIRVRRQLALSGFALAAACCIGITIATSSATALLAFCGLFAGLGMLVPGYMPVPGELLPVHGDVLYGFMAGIGSITSAGLVALVGILLENTGSYDMLFYLIAILAVAAIILFYFFAQATPIEVDEAS